MGKLLIATGIVLTIVGALWHFGLLSAIPIGRLPGDLIIERDGTKLYIPIVSCIIISLLISGLMRLIK